MESRINSRAAAAALTLLAALAIFPSAHSARQADQPARTVWDGAYTEGQAKRGAEAYAQQCAGCHRDDLMGADEVPALAGPGFLSNWDGLTVDDLFERVRVSMPPNKQGRLSRQQIVDILSYVLKTNAFPAGKAELDPRAEMLKQVRIQATKPNPK